MIATLLCVALATPPAQATDTIDPARRIIAAAIARKHERRATLHDYYYRADVTLVLQDLDRSRDAARSIAAITETQSEAYWQTPDRYQETILARRRMGGVGAGGNVVAIGEIVNFNRERIELGRYSLVAPLADDATGSYRYRIVDSLFWDNPARRVYRLAIEPRTNASPLFVGTIDIVDSTFDVAAIDLGVNDVVQLPFITNLRYQVSLRDLGNDVWMPDAIRLTGDVSLKLPVVHLTVPVPGFPRRGAFEQVAALSDFRFAQGHPPKDLGEVRVRVDKHADRMDSAVWTAPRSDAEEAAWAREYSRRERPSAVARVRRAVEGARFMATGPEVHYNRVDGALLGLYHTERLPGAILAAKLGRAGATDELEGSTQYRFGGQVRVSEPHQLWLGGSYYDETTPRPTLTARLPGDVTRGAGDDLNALLFGRDLQDYYRAHGYALTASVRVLPFTRLDLHYTDETESSLSLAAYPLFGNRQFVRPNPPIADGQLRSVTAAVTYDSRPVIRRFDADTRLRQLTSTRITLTGEVAAAAPEWSRYSLQIERRQPTLGLGLTTLTLAGATTTGAIPPQREFGVNFGFFGWSLQRGHGALSDSSVYATRVALVKVHHDFGRLLFRGLPLTFAVDAGTFWTAPANSHSYRLGFQVGNLTPFLSPFDLGLRFDWRFFNSERRFQFGVVVGP
jgi:hypothetical protein